METSEVEGTWETGWRGRGSFLRKQTKAGGTLAHLFPLSLPCFATAAPGEVFWGSKGRSPDQRGDIWRATQGTGPATTHWVWPGTLGNLADVGSKADFPLGAPCRRFSCLSSC